MPMRNEMTEFGYLSYPDATAGASASPKAPAIIVVHEIWGLNDQTKGVADRFARELGFLALAPDLLKGEIDAFDPAILREMQDPATRDEAQKKMRTALAPVNTPEFAARTVTKLRTCFDFLKNHENGDGTVGIIGFCFGGSYAFALAGFDGIADKLKFAIPFYGAAPAEDVIAKIVCPVFAFYGDKDERLMATLPALEAAMKSHGKNFRAIVYPGVGHAFFNEKNINMYNAEAAGKAWEEVRKFLD